MKTELSKSTQLVILVDPYAIIFLLPSRDKTLVQETGERSICRNISRHKIILKQVGLCHQECLLRYISQKKVYVAELGEETYHSACPQTMQFGNSQETKPQRRREINTTCIRGYYATTQARYDPGNTAKNSYEKEALFLCSVANFQTQVPVSETLSISHIFLYLKKKMDPD